jgi:hypothetical protein
MSKKHIICAVITLLAVTTGTFLYRKSASSNQRPIASTPLSEQSRESIAAQKPASSTLSPETNPGSRLVPTDDKNIKKVRTYVSSDDMSRKEYSALIRTKITLTFGKAIKGLRLSPESEAKLMGFLAEREEVYRDVRDFANKNPQMPSSEFKASIDEAYAIVDQQIKAAFSAEKYAQIRDMIFSSAFLMQINVNYDPYLTEDGHPLTPEQMIPVAKVMAEGYRRLDDPETLPTLSNVDPESGLTEIDRAVLARLRPILTPEQLGLFQEATVNRNNKYQQLLRIQAAERKP